MDHPTSEPLPEKRASVEPESSPRGHVAYLWTRRRGHASWHCRTCEAVVYGPSLNTHCAALEGPAVVRISNVLPIISGRSNRLRPVTSCPSVVAGRGALWPRSSLP